MVVDLTSAESTEVRDVLDKLMCTNDRLLTTAGLPTLAAASRALPGRLRVAIETFKKNPRAGAILVRGLPIDEKQLPPTPPHWRAAAIDPPDHYDVLLTLLSGLLGDVFAWEAEQEGRLVQNIVPIAEHRDEQISTGSRQDIWWHTEDALHPHPPDVVALLCLRNLERAASTYCGLAELTLTQQTEAALRMPDFVFRPDLSHTSETQLAVARAVLSNGGEDPHIRIDNYFMDEPTTSQAVDALRALSTQVDLHLQDVVLETGDCIFIDNVRSVHGRRGFDVENGEQRRWLKRVRICTDINRVASFRVSADHYLLR